MPEAEDLGEEPTGPLSPCWSAACDGCGIHTVIDAGDAKGVPDTSAWEEFPRCIVCGDTLYFDEQTETLWDRETRLMNGARSNLATKVRLALESTEGRDASVEIVKQAVLAALPPLEEK